MSWQNFFCFSNLVPISGQCCRAEQHHLVGTKVSGELRRLPQPVLQVARRLHLPARQRRRRRGRPEEPGDEEPSQTSLRHRLEVHPDPEAGGHRDAGLRRATAGGRLLVEARHRILADREGEPGSAGEC